jgi:guanylate kinase
VLLDAESELARLRKEWRCAWARAPVVGITGTGGAGKSSVTDELLARFLRHFPEHASRCSRSIRRAGAPGARCSAIASA